MLGEKREWWEREKRRLEVKEWRGKGERGEKGEGIKGKKKWRGEARERMEIKGRWEIGRE